MTPSEDSTHRVPPGFDVWSAVVYVAICGLAGLVVAESFGISRIVALGAAMMASLIIMACDLVSEEELEI